MWARAWPFLHARPARDGLIRPLDTPSRAGVAAYPHPNGVAVLCGLFVRVCVGLCEVSGAARRNTLEAKHGAYRGTPETLVSIHAATLECNGVAATVHGVLPKRNRGVRRWRTILSVSLRHPWVTLSRVVVAPVGERAFAVAPCLHRARQSQHNSSCAASTCA
jgi:hypothetical protein